MYFFITITLLACIWHEHHCTLHGLSSTVSSQPSNHLFKIKQLHSVSRFLNLKVSVSKKLKFLKQVPFSINSQKRLDLPLHWLKLSWTSLLQQWSFEMIFICHLRCSCCAFSLFPVLRPHLTDNAFALAEFLPIKYEDVWGRKQKWRPTCTLWC